MGFREPIHFLVLRSAALTKRIAVLGTRMSQSKQTFPSVITAWTWEGWLVPVLCSFENLEGISEDWPGFNVAFHMCRIEFK